MTDAATAGAIVFTDIVGFTEFTAQQGDTEALAVLDRQERLVRSALPDRARIVKELGDGLLLWFPEAGSALDASLGLLERFTDVSGDETPLWVRMGMHWGSPTPRGDDIVGHAVNLAARIVDMAGPGELLVSEDARVAVDSESRNVTFDELGPIVMRGIPDPVPLYRASRSLALTG
ncbi:MAG TPA: adenylate/guanylate cyclase domain-containing protein [Acidimicrobiia bacterium]|nr:adenylate/guanylate cyclase domain-containing protein [Acidimicrobiia bacterium]